MTEERWLPVSLDGRYQVSNLGRVKRAACSMPWGPRGAGMRHFPEALLTPSPLKSTGYVQVRLSGRKKHSVHRLVATAFLPNPRDLPQVNHLDGDRANNAVENLEWCDGARNQRHSYETNLARIRPALGKFGLDSPAAKPMTFNGETLSVAEWAARRGWNANVIYGRVRDGWSVEEILSTPLGARRGKR